MAKSKIGYAKSARTKRKEQRARIGVKKKEFSFYGYSVEELKQLSFEEVLPLLPSRSRRSLKRGLTREQHKLWETVKKTEAGNPIRTHCRNMIILPEFIGHTIDIYNGQEFQSLHIQPQMVGHYLGEFALTRKKVKHTGPGVGATRSSKFMPLK